jgi:flagellin
MRINHNIAALNTYRQLSANTVNTSRSLEKLSSGLRINRAGDDAAGLAISEKMRSQIRGLETAARNANDGISLIQTAEGALNETHSILQRMKELAVQAANDTNTDEDRAEIQKEIDQLKTEITRIADQTEFNTKKLLDGSMASEIEITSGTGITNVTVAAGASVQNGTYTVEVSYTAAKNEVNAEISNFDGTDVGLSGASILPESTYDGEYNVKVAEGTDDDTYKIILTDALGAEIDARDNIDNDFVGDVELGDITFTFNAASATVGDVDFEVTAYEGPKDAVFNVITITGEDEEGNSITDINSSDFVFTYTDTDLSTDDNFEVKFEVTDNSMIFHIGANQGQNTSLSINKMDAESLGVNALDLTSQSSADEAITTIDEAISKVSSQRAALGAMQNRLEHTINNLGTAAENLTAAESRIRDVDMAKEMMEFTKNSILSQASQAMLAQANLQPQSVLQLLQ